MKKVIIRAPLLSYSGYGTHSRQIFRWLLTQPDIEVITSIVPWGITPWMINPSFEDGLIEKIMNRSAYDQNASFDISIQVQLPNEWDSSLANKNIGVSAFVETDTCNPQWVECCNKMDRIVVPSQHTCQVIKNSGHCRTPISVVPEAFYDVILKKDLPEFQVDFETSFNFLLLGQITGQQPDTDRKNIFNSIKWFCETFKNDSDVGLILKTNSGKNTTIDRTLSGRMIIKLLDEVREGPFPKIHFLHGALSPTEIASLYRHPKIKAMINFTRGEGFGLPLLEAAASGLPVLATNWSGHLDFLRLGKFIPIDYRLEPISSARVDGDIFVQDAKWAEPLEDNIKQRLRKFYKAPFIPQKWAQELKVNLLSRFCQENINQLYDVELGEYFR
ncbi:hypothetical protein CL614_09540 [archaeon]|jgi:hypothetical protein|nr:hypothetical protein [archaeon]